MQEAKNIIDCYNKEAKNYAEKFIDVLKDNGQFLFAFHVGNDVIHFDNFLDHEVNIDFYFLETNKIASLLKESGFEMLDVIERQPYPGIEHQSKRAYIWAKSSSH